MRDSVRRLGMVLGIVAALLLVSAVVFVVAAWPALVPRTWLGWGIAALLGLPVWAVLEGLIAFAIGDAGRPADELERRYSLEDVRRAVPAADRAKRFAVVVLRVAVGLCAFALAVWLLMWVLRLPLVQAQFGSDL